MFLLFVIILGALIYFTGIKPLKYWKERGVPHSKPWPYFGNRILTIFRQRAMLDVLNDNYHSFSQRRYFGFYNMTSPVLILRDPDIIKRITVEEFETFSEHRRFIPDDVDILWSKNLFAMRGGKEWQNMRAALSPAFTGSKLKRMFPLMNECSKQFSNHFLNQKHLVTVELKDAFTRFANDVIATTAFGVTCNSLQDRTNEFYLRGKVISNVTGWRNFTQTLYLLSPKLSKIMKFPFYPKAERVFFKTLVEKIINTRGDKGVTRPDVIDLLTIAKNKQHLPLTNEDITAQVLIFFFAGFDTFSTMACYICYELAMNPEVQATLYKEINTTLNANHGDITHDILMKMEYLDMVIEEGLRKWPPFIYIDRCTVKPFTIEPIQSEEKTLYLDSGTVCIIPVISIQRDPKYFPEPEKFDPDRFSKTNKHKINPYTYLPFGIGPRNCIGSRFALLEGKLILTEVISKFEIVPVEQTKIPLIMNAGRNNAVPRDGFWLGLKPRKS